MRKRTVKHFFDELLWFFIYAMPFIICLYSFKQDTSISYLTQLDSFLTSIHLDTNVVYTAFIDLFGTNGVFPLFSSNILLKYLSYFICALIVHVAVDILALIPRICHNLVDKASKD